MNLFSAAERISAIDRSQVRLDAARCLHAIDRFSACAGCVDFCPLGAIQGGKPPALDEQACANCLACLAVCPTGAFTADDSFAALLNCAARLETSHIELACQAHPQPAFGPPGATTSVQIRGCLASLGAGAYLTLLSLGVTRVTLRMDACQECKLEPLRERVCAHLQEAGQIALAWGWSGAFDALTDLPEAGWTERTVFDAHNPPLSRRDLFRMASRQGQIAAARAMAEADAPSGKRLPRARGRVLIGVSKLQAPRVGDPSLAGLGYALLAASPDCTACGACTRICPTGALSMPVEDNRFRLSFSARACTACGSCLHACAPGALRLDPAPVFSQVFSEPAEVELLAGELAKCGRCGVPYAARPGEKYCALCAYRIQHPFGHQPPGMKRP